MADKVTSKQVDYINQLSTMKVSALDTPFNVLSNFMDVKGVEDISELNRNDASTIIALLSAWKKYSKQFDV